MAYTSEKKLILTDSNIELEIKKSQDKLRLTITPIITGMADDDNSKTFLVKLEDIDLLAFAMKQVKLEIMKEKQENS